MSAFWSGFEKRAASMSGMPGVRSGGLHAGVAMAPKPGVAAAPRAAKQALPTPKPVAPATTAAMPAPIRQPAGKVHVPKPVMQTGRGVPSMAI